MSAHARPYPATVSVSPVSRTVLTRRAQCPHASFDDEVGALWIQLRPLVSDGGTYQDHRAVVNLDYGKLGELVAVEVLLDDWERPWDRLCPRCGGESG